MAEDENRTNNQNNTSANTGTNSSGDHEAPSDEDEGGRPSDKDWSSD